MRCLVLGDFAEAERYCCAHFWELQDTYILLFELPRGKGVRAVQTRWTPRVSVYESSHFE